MLWTEIKLFKKVLEVMMSLEGQWRVLKEKQKIVDWFIQINWMMVKLAYKFTRFISLMYKGSIINIQMVTTFI